MSVEEFYQEVLARQDAGEMDDMSNVIFDHIDDLLCGGKFEECDRILDSADCMRLSPEAMITLLMSTCMAKDDLKTRDDFWARCCAACGEIDALSI